MAADEKRKNWPLVALPGGTGLRFSEIGAMFFFAMLNLNNSLHGYRLPAWVSGLGLGLAWAAVGYATVTYMLPAYFALSAPVYWYCIPFVLMSVFVFLLSDGVWMVYRWVLTCLFGALLTVTTASVFLSLHPAGAAHRKAVAGRVVSLARRVCRLHGARFATDGKPDGVTYLPSGLTQDTSDTWTASCYKQDGEVFSVRLFLPESR